MARQTTGSITQWRTKRAQTAYSLFFFFFLAPKAALAADSNVIAGAIKETEVVWYTNTPLDVSNKIAEGFQRKYRFIRPLIFRTNNNPMLARILAEASAGRSSWDVIGGGGELYTPLIRRQLLAPYRSPETKSMDPDLYDAQGYWTAYTASTHVLGFNTKQLSKADVPKSYEGLLHARWKGRMIAMDRSGGMMHALSNVWGKEKTSYYFKQLATQGPVIQEGNTLRAQLIAAGEFPLGFVLAHGSENLATRGAPTDWIALEPAVMRIVVLGLAASAPHPHAARLFYDFIISKEGQEILKGFNRVPVRKDVDPDPARLIRGYQRVTMFPEMFADLEATQRVYDQIFNLR